MLLLQNEQGEIMPLSEDQMERIIEKALKIFCEKWGFDDKTAEDLRHLRKWRESTNRAAAVSFVTAVGVLTTGFMGALLITIKYIITGHF